MSDPTAPRAELPFREKLLYGVGGIPLHFANTGIKSLAVPVYQMTLHIDPVLLGAAVAVPRIWDAVTDPLMGHISDRTRSQFGRRKPYIVVGALLSCVAFALVWMVPVSWNPMAQLGWFLGTSLLFYTCCTVWMVPYQSLGYELTSRYHERTGIMGIQTLMSRIADFGYQWVFPLTQLAVFATAMQGVRVVTVAVAVLVFGICGLLPGLFARERFAQKTDVEPRVSFAQSFRAVMRNRGLLVLAALTLLKLMANMFASSLDYYLLVYSMFDGDIVRGSIWKGILSSAYAVVGVAAVGPVIWLSRRFDKQRALAIVYGLVVVGGLVKWWVFQPGNTWLILLDPLFNAPIWIGLYMLVPSMIADLCDEDELRNGVRREGMFSAFFSWCTKLGASLAVLGSGITLAWAGFDASLGGAQAPGTMTNLRLVFALITSVLAVIALAVLYYYPLNREKALEIRTQLEARRGVV